MTYAEMEYRVNDADDLIKLVAHQIRPVSFVENNKTDLPSLRLLIKKQKGWQRYTKHFARQSYRNAAR